MTSPLVNFHKHDKPNDDRLTLERIHTFDFQDLEDIHTYIQWIFPLDEPSRAIPWSPVLTQDDINELRGDVQVQARLYKSLCLMCRFYGFNVLGIDNDRIEIKIDMDEFQERYANWISPYNHNYLRLTRILKSLRLLGCEDWADQLYNVLEQVYNLYPKIISKTTFEFWQNAVGK